MTSRRSGPDYWISHAGILHLSYLEEVDPFRRCGSGYGDSLSLLPKFWNSPFPAEEMRHSVRKPRIRPPLSRNVRLRTTIIVRIVQQE